MQQNPQVLIIGTDSALKGEFEAATESLRLWQPLVHHAYDRRQGIEIARSRQPDIVLVELQMDLPAMRSLATELLTSAPDTAVIVVYRKRDFGSEDQQSQFLIGAMRAGVNRLSRWLSNRRGVSDPHDRAAALLELARGALLRPAAAEDALLQAVRARVDEFQRLDAEIHSWIDAGELVTV